MMKKSIRQIVKKRIASVFMSAVLAVTGVGLLPQFAMPAQAADASFNLLSGSVNYNAANSAANVVTIEITGQNTTTDNTITINVPSGKKVIVTLSNVDIDVSAHNDTAAVLLTGAGEAEIVLVGDNVLKSGYNCAGLQDILYGSLTIRGTGSLDATGGSEGAGIGTGISVICGDINISGGVVSGTGGDYGSGIGAGSSGTCGDITISGGEVSGTGGDHGSGIGSGHLGACGDITISGGEVSGTGGASGIGCGEYSECGVITISGGVVSGICRFDGAGIGTGPNGICGDIIISGDVVSGTSGEGGTGIGGGNFGTCGKITISGGEVSGTGGNYGAGIGTGMYGTSGDITISGGEVNGIGGVYSAGIGNGCTGTLENIIIYGGTVYASGGIAGAGIGGDYFDAAPNIIIRCDPQIHVSGGLDNSYGDGAGIGEGGRDNGTAGSEGGDFTGLWTTGTIYYYPNGTEVDDMKNGTVQPASVTIGSIDPSSADPEPPINWMQEVEDKITAAIALGGPQTVYIEGYPTLSYHVLEMLQQHPEITLVSEFSYDGLDYKITIPGSAVELNPAVNWYGPKYLFPMFYMYGTDTAPAVQAYLEKYA